ncbi:EAL domain-containing protein [Paenibacillus turpanensis]|uniref:EAL domain-containing protein n=1 Tax=Paenibacillus turpanensis TaxID=2689078 RepID=UPI001FB62CE2|nr:EAL domain-containing protein [Paenibacillus turpanensis]
MTKAFEALNTASIPVEVNETEMKLPYQSKEQLLNVLHQLQTLYPDNESDLVQIEVVKGFPEAPRFGEEPAFSTLKQFTARLKHYDMMSHIQDGKFTSHLQPIVSFENQSIFGYEFVLRPLPGEVSFRPYELFYAAQEAGLHSFLDRQARISAIRVSAELLPHGIKRFINFLPSSIYNPNYCLSHTFQAVERYQVNPRDLVFEVVETEKITNIAHLQSIFDVYKKNGMQVALDDVGSGFSTLEVLRALQPDYVKIDRGIISFCDQDNQKQQKIKEILEIAESFGATVLAEGIERIEEWEFCKTAGIDLAQGYLLGKPEHAPLRENKIHLS